MSLISQDRALEAMREVTSAPMFGMGDYELGRGIIGGPLMQTVALGQEAAQEGLRILKGDTPGGIDPPSVVFVERRLTIGGNYVTGVSVRPDCLPVAMCSFVSRLRGNNIAGRS